MTLRNFINDFQKRYLNEPDKHTKSSAINRTTYRLFKDPMSIVRVAGDAGIGARGFSGEFCRDSHFVGNWSCSFAIFSLHFCSLRSSGGLFMVSMVVFMLVLVRDLGLYGALLERDLS